MTSSLESLNRLLSLRETNPFKLVGHKQVRDEIKIVEAHFDPKQFDTLEILHFTDVQWGSKECKEDRVIEYRDWVLSKPNRFVLFGGDMIDAATSQSVASPYSNKYDPWTQIQTFCEVMMPMAHRILGYVGGNHENRIARKSDGPDAAKIIAQYLQIPFSLGKQLIDVHFGKHDP